MKVIGTKNKKKVFHAKAIHPRTEIIYFFLLDINKAFVKRKGNAQR